jgi:putative RNA 2'-phosphotransferase
LDDARLVRTSKFLSKHLRHQPARLGLTLAPGGWVDVEALLVACAAHGMPITRAELDEVVARNNKQRFGYDETGTRIRANQGHSVEVDLQLEPVAPPAVLCHGTGQGTAEAIRREGLRRMRRHHVHLSPDVATATAVGARHGRPVVFAVDAAAMHAAGFVFYRSANGVWLVERVPPEYLRPA